MGNPEEGIHGGEGGGGIEMDCKVCHLKPTLFYLVQIKIPVLKDRFMSLSHCL